MITKLAWKNIWRNKRRSFITIFAVALAVFFALNMRCMQLGMYDSMVSNMVDNKFGYIQIHANGYWDERIVDNSFFEEDIDVAALERIDGVSIERRLETGALASFNESAKGAMLLSFESNSIKDSLLNDQLIEGKVALNGTNEVVIGRDLAAFFKASIGDTLVLMGMGYHGSTAASLNVIAGIADLQIPDLNKFGIYMQLNDLQNFIDAPGAYSSMVVNLEYPKDMLEVQAIMKAQLGNEFEIMNWEELLPALKQIIVLDSAGGIIMISILYMIISFVIFGTTIMAVQERKYELGILLAIGMKKAKSIRLVFLETTFLNLIGIGIGLLLAIPLAIYMNLNPVPLTGEAADSMREMGVEAVIKFSKDPDIFLTHAGIVLLISSIIALYPIMTIVNMHPLTAMKK